MSYLSNFEHSFLAHTLELVRTYRGEFDATLMMNCLLGLLIVPKEKFLQQIPEDSLEDLAKWGITPDSIKQAGQPTSNNPRPDTLRGLVTNLRHAVAHFSIKPIPATAAVHSFEYKNDSGLHAVISVAEMRVFVDKLSAYLASK